MYRNILKPNILHNRTELITCVYYTGTKKISWVFSIYVVVIICQMIQHGSFNEPQIQHTATTTLLIASLCNISTIVFITIISLIVFHKEFRIQII